MSDKKWHGSAKNSSCRGRKNNPDNFAAIKMLIGGEPSKIDEDSGSVVFLWKGEKWYDKFDEIAFVGELMGNLPQEDFLFIRLGEDYDDIETRGSFCGKPFGMNVEKNRICVIIADNDGRYEEHEVSVLRISQPGMQ